MSEQLRPDQAPATSEDAAPRVGTIDSQPATTAPAQDVIVDEREGISFTTRSFGRQTWDRFRRHKVAMFAAALLILLAISFWVAPVLSPYGFRDIDVAAMRQGPSIAHPFGTDQIGRDLMVRTFHGGRFSLRIALVVALLTTLIGTIIGSIAGYFGGVVDTLLSQVINLFLIVPALVVLLVVGVRYGASPNGIAIILAFLLWPGIARVVRGLFLQYREQEFVLAAKAAGARAPRIIVRHILPNTFGPIIVNATLLIGTAIILESTLSFLGVGVTPPTPTLGNLVNEAKGAIDSRPSTILIPGGFVVLIALCVNFLGDGLRDALDPTTRKG
ncbi:MAG: ABC transporter permease [Actinobacteria bacterium]|nr:ABC transporter permease [Actinomycetota bacterium]